MYDSQAPLLDALRIRGMRADLLDAAVNTADESGRPLRDVLVAQGAATEVELAEALADAYGLKSIDLTTYPIDAAAAAKLPFTLARRHKVLGIAIDDVEIVVAITDPGDVLALDDVRAATGMVVRPVVVARDELMKALDRFQRAENDLDDVAASLVPEEPPRRSSPRSATRRRSCATSTR